MSLFQPTNIFPSSFAGVGGGVVDVTQGFTVSWQVNGSSAMTAYQIQIFENTSRSDKVYDSGKTSVSPAFFGTNSTGQVNFFEVPIAASTLSRMSNGFSSGYKMLITQWWGTNSVQQLYPSFFWTRTGPTIRISAFANPVTENTATFSGMYTQAQGDSLDWFRWMLAVFGSAGINAGNITSDEDIKGVAIYRKSSSVSKLDFVVNVPIETTMILDEGFINQEQYTYYVFVLGQSTYISPALISNVVQPMFWS